VGVLTAGDLDSASHFSPPRRPPRRRRGKSNRRQRGERTGMLTGRRRSLAGGESSI
jgi:hypothetical protein